MGAHEEGRALLDSAKSDLRALLNMRDREAFDDRVVGFHAQQAVEKALKAWLNALGEIHPYTHDLRILLEKLETHGCNMESYWDFVELNSYATRFRYESPPMDDEPLNREQLGTDVCGLVEYVETLLI
ncbi:MAG: HEPN domain-containing protein [Candidatus Hydrogenedentota bacterium]